MSPNQLEAIYCGARAAVVPAIALVGAMLDGSPIAVQCVDKDRRVPGFRSSVERYEAFTTWFRFLRVDLLERYSQVASVDAYASGDVSAFRWQRDAEILTEMGVDVPSLRVILL